MSQPAPFQSRFAVIPQVRALRQNLYGVRVHFVESGDGDPPILLLHGGHAGGAGDTVWQFTIPALSRHFRTFGLDLLGSGLSDAPMIEYSFQAQVEMLIGLIDVLGIEKVSVVGQSRGAYVAAKFACDYPTRTSHVVLIDTGTVSDSLGIDLGPPNTAFNLRDADTSGDRDKLRQLLSAMTYRTDVLTDEHLDDQLRLTARPGVKEARWSVDKYYFETLRRDPNQFQLYSLKDRLPKLTLPIMIIWGADDEFMPVRLGRQLHELLPRAEYHEIPNAKHHVFHDQPEMVNDLLIRFFQSRPKEA